MLNGKRWSCIALVAALALCALSCAGRRGGGVQSAGAGATSLQAIAQGVRSGQSHLRSTMSYLEGMVDAPVDLPSQFRAYRESLARFSAQVDRMLATAAAVRSDTGRLMAEWLHESALLRGEEIAAQSQRRVAETQAHLTALRADFLALSESLASLRQRFDDIRVVLEADLTVVNVRAVTAPADAAYLEGERVLAKLDAPRDELMALGLDMDED